MTEQEIVECLKENKTKGIAYLFMHEDVWHWIGKNLNNSKLLYLAPKGTWKRVSETDFNDSDDYDNLVFTLPDNYEIDKYEDKKGEWIEFDITDKGLFFLEYTDRGGSNVSHRFYWHQWSQFLEYCDIDELKYTVFGGWQYKDCDAWFLTPQIAMQGHFYNLCTKDDEPKPAIPTKIRFWRK